jgi:hypothetical protein
MVAIHARPRPSATTGGDHWSRRATSSVTLRSKIVLACADGRTTRAVAAQLGCNRGPRWRIGPGSNRQHRSSEFKGFLTTIDQTVPEALDTHIVRGTYGTYGTYGKPERADRAPPLEARFLVGSLLAVDELVDGLVVPAQLGLDGPQHVLVDTSAAQLRKVLLQHQPHADQVDGAGVVEVGRCGPDDPAGTCFERGAVEVLPRGHGMTVHGGSVAFGDRQ